MELVLTRFAYLNEGTLGRLVYGRGSWCFTLERPWLNNAQNVSCIPEGRYKIEPDREGRGRERGYPELLNVIDRSEILIHPANKTSELKGCIAPGRHYLLSPQLALLESASAYADVKAALFYVDDWLVVTHMEATLDGISHRVPGT